MKLPTYSARAQITYRDKYCRPKEDGTVETRMESYKRVLRHQRRLWEEAKGLPLSNEEEQELQELFQLIVEGKVFLAGRTHWLGGTDLAFDLPACQFNCAGLVVETVYDIVDLVWLLLLGCGVGAKAQPGTLVGLYKYIPEIEVIRSTRTDKGGAEENVETYEDGVWTIKVGDSAQAWAKAVGKVMVGQHPADKLVLDFSEIRPAGLRLKGFGWICNGDAQLAEALTAIVGIRNNAVDSLLNRHQINDIINWIGTILSTRRSAEILFNDYGNDDWIEFSEFKKDHTTNGQWHRGQSNNSNIFWRKPSREELVEYWRIKEEAGGSEPGLINGEAARRRAPWFSVLNPCAEILLPNKGFCNLVSIVVSEFKNDRTGLFRAASLVARANYRQTCVDLSTDPILQETWHTNNQHLHLCGVSQTGCAERPDLKEYELKSLERHTTAAAYSMADELGLPRPKNVTTIDFCRLAA